VIESTDFVIEVTGCVIGVTDFDLLGETETEKENQNGRLKLKLSLNLQYRIH